VDVDGVVAGGLWEWVRASTDEWLAVVTFHLRYRDGRQARHVAERQHGLFGRGEEEEKIVPAVERARDEGIDVSGPLPADTVFFRAGRGDFDLVVAMYHDQGHGPVKVLGLDAGVNVRVGLPVIRTSVDHGTAFDIAGTGRADERSMVEALRQAAELADARSLVPGGADSGSTGGAVGRTTR
jgi:hypothetical protein